MLLQNLPRFASFLVAAAAAPLVVVSVAATDDASVGLLVF
jgi:hypothetical protein